MVPRILRQNIKALNIFRFSRFLEKDKYQILFFGNLWMKRRSKKNIEYYNLGFVKKNIQRYLYSTADVFVHHYKKVFRKQWLNLYCVKHRCLF